MNIEVRDYVSVSQRLTTLGVLTPTGLAFLPDNLATATTIEELRQHVETDTVRTLMRANNISYSEIFGEDEQPAFLQQYSFEWFGPTMFVAAGMLSHDPDIVSVSLGIITNYLYDLFKGTQGGKASLNVVVQQADGSCKEVRYSGPPDGLGKVAEIIRELGAGSE